MNTEFTKKILKVYCINDGKGLVNYCSKVKKFSSYENPIDLNLIP
jgi:hypothetical protein